MYSIMFLWPAARTNCPREAEIQHLNNPAKGERGAQKSRGNLWEIRGKTPRVPGVFPFK